MPQNHTQDIRQSMDITRKAISERLANVEGVFGQQLRETVNHASERVIKTIDHFSNRLNETQANVRKTTDYMNQTIRASIQDIQKQTDMPEKIRRSPIKSMTIAAGCGLLIGAMRAKNTQRRAIQLRREIAAIFPDRVKSLQQESPWQGVALSVSAHVVKLLLQTGTSLLLKRLINFKAQQLGVQETDIPTKGRSATAI